MEELKNYYTFGTHIEFDDRNFQKNKKKGKIVKKIYFEKISMVLSKWWLWARIMILVHKKKIMIYNTIVH